MQPIIPHPHLIARHMTMIAHLRASARRMIHARPQDARAALDVAMALPRAMARGDYAQAQLLSIRADALLNRLCDNLPHPFDRQAASNALRVAV